MQRTAIPGTFGLPVLGATIPIILDGLAFTRRQQQKYGRTFKTRFMGKPTAVLVGAEAQRLVLGANNADTQFSTYGGYAFVVPFIGNAILTIDGEPHTMQRKLITPAFHSRHYGVYIDRINHIVADVTATWAGEAPRSFYQDSREITFRMANSLVLNIEAGPEYQQLQKDWVKLFKGIVDPFKLNLPFTLYGQSMRAKRKVDAFLRQVIAQHRVTKTTDILGLLMETRHEDDTPLSEQELLDHARFLLFAGYDTTASTMAWALLELLQHPDILAQVQAEVGGDRPDAAVTLDEIMHMPLLDAVIKETLRLHTPTTFLSRGVTTAMEYDGYTIPAGWNVMIMHSVTHRMADYFTDPERFDPARFMPPREEDKKTPYAWVGFGSGAHVCIGMGIAQIEIKTVLARLLRRFAFTLVPGQDVTPQYVPINRPKSGTTITFHSRGMA